MKTGIYYSPKTCTPYSDRKAAREDFVKKVLTGRGRALALVTESKDRMNFEVSFNIEGSFIIHVFRNFFQVQEFLNDAFPGATTIRGKNGQQ